MNELTAGRELDALVAEKVMGKPPSYYHCPHFDEKGRMLSFCGCPCLPHYSANIAKAWEVVEKMREDDFWWSATYKTTDMGDGSEGPPFYRARFRCVRGATRGDHFGEADTLPFAICLAALKAVGYELPETVEATA